MTLTPHGTEIKLHTRALLVWLTISAWAGRKFDQGITDKVHGDLHTSQDAGRYNKHLLAKSANLKALTGLISTIRTEHYEKTLAWNDEGWRLLTTANYLPYTEWFGRQSAALDRAVDDMIAGYYSDIQADRQRLNGSFDASDYPSPLDLRGKFSVRLQYMPLPADGDVRVDLAADQVNAIETSVREQMASCLQNAVSDSWQRLRDVVAHVANRLSEPDAIFRDSLLDNVRKTCDALAGLNVADDPKLDAMRQLVCTDILRFSARELRAEPLSRQETAKRAAAILDAMKGF